MTTANLTFSAPVYDAPVVITQASVATPQTLAAYATWYSTGNLIWTAQASDIVLCTTQVTGAVSAVTAAGTDRLAVLYRSRLFNTTTGSPVEQWASVNTVKLYQRIGAIDYGPLLFVGSINERFTTKDLLIPGNSYEWRAEIAKFQDVGTPTMTVVVIDDTTYSDAAGRRF